MKKSIIICSTLFTIFLFPFWSYAQNQVPHITNVKASIDTSTQSINVLFDLNDAEGDIMEVWIQASVDGGNTWVVPVQSNSLSGDFGMNITSGKGMSISWFYDKEVLSTYSSGLTDLMIRVIADDHLTIPLTEILNKIDSARIVSTLYQYEGIRHHTSNPVFKNKVKDSLESLFSSEGIYHYRQGGIYQSHQIENIVGFSSGTRTPSNSWMASGHYDTVSNSPGADDNGTGMVAVAEAIRVLSEYNTKNSLRYHFFDLEEPGLIGSQDYVESGIPFWENMQGLLNMDGIGYYSDKAYSQSLPNGFNQLFGAQYNVLAADSFRGNFITSVYNTASANLGSTFSAVANTYVPNLKVLDLETPGKGNVTPDFRRSDHSSFWDIGIPALFLADGSNFRSPYYHSSKDSIHYLDMGFLVKNVRAIVLTLAQYAGLEHSGCTESNILSIELPFARNGTDSHNKSIAIYPNPSSNSITIKKLRANANQILIVNLTGNKVLRKGLKSTSELLDLNVLKSKGVYLIKVLDSSGNLISTEKLIYQ